MLTFLHCYTDELWKGYEINGLIGKGFGILIRHIQQMKGQTGGGFTPDARQTLQLFGQPLQRRNRVAHIRTYPAGSYRR